jgi:hypothetical protein
MGTFAMRRSGLLLALGALLLTGTAHAQCNIASKLCAVANNFNPVPKPPNNPDNKSPSCGGSVAAIPFIDAFNAASPDIRTSLCQLKNIFVSSGPQGWGRFNDPSKHGHDPHQPNDQAGDSYIAVAQPDIGKTFSQLQDQNLKFINAGVAANINHAETNTVPGLGLLYAMAHELGHVIWHKQYPLGQPLHIACYDANFASSWQHPNSGKGRRWTEFDDETIDNHPDANIKMPKAATTPAEMADIYKVYATALAGANPEEDFVDTYALEAVFSSTHCAQNNCTFTMNFSTGIPAVPLNGDRGTMIAGKRQCANTAISTLHPAPQIKRQRRHR